jgi:hypothetical protein
VNSAPNKAFTVDRDEALRTLAMKHLRSAFLSAEVREWRQGAVWVMSTRALSAEAV